MSKTAAIAAALAVVSASGLAQELSSDGGGGSEAVVYPAHEEPVHKPVFHNARIHVYEVQLQPGQSTSYHRHTQDQLGVGFGDGTVSNQVLGSPGSVAKSVPLAITYVPHSTWGGTVHRVRDISGKFHVIGIEFADPAPAGTKTAVAPPNQDELVVPQGALRRVTIAPGASRSLTGALLVAAEPGRLKLSDGTNWAFATGGVRWIGDQAGQRFTNHTRRSASLLLLTLNK